MNATPTSGYELPDRYEKDMLQLMARDSHSMHVYWEIGNRKRWLCSQHFQCDYGTLPKALRVYDVTSVYFNGSNANSYFDVNVTPEANNWYIHGLTPGATYLVDLGVYSIERQFITLLRSNCAATARDSAAPWGAPLVPVFDEAAHPIALFQRLMPQHFENFNAYSNCMK
ncbi:DUF4912 domain-containing protein [Paenibacillus sp. YYML68]|uniref:DUF4912 domain-containing protein n=1 Tax=Paenibacillus sp. YYML68 TaxID=2909250 RepID=UPI00249211F4|nr:DUF4912 domain-containing protein [Paenibacillus sp. YYML68]